LGKKTIYGWTQVNSYNRFLLFFAGKGTPPSLSGGGFIMSEKGRSEYSATEVEDFPLYHINNRRLKATVFFATIDSRISPNRRTRLLKPPLCRR